MRVVWVFQEVSRLDAQGDLRASEVNIHSEAPKVTCSPLALEGYKAGFHRVLSGYSFLPVCQYPVGWEVDKYEEGSLVKFGRDGIIREVCRRIFQKR